MPDRQGYLCPRCGSVAMGTFSRSDSVWCPNRDCKQLCWDPRKTRQENLAAVKTI